MVIGSAALNAVVTEWAKALKNPKPKTLRPPKAIKALSGRPYTPKPQAPNPKFQNPKPKLSCLSRVGGGGGVQRVGGGGSVLHDSLNGPFPCSSIQPDPYVGAFTMSFGFRVSGLGASGFRVGVFVFFFLLFVCFSVESGLRVLGQF